MKAYVKQVLVHKMFPALNSRVLFLLDSLIHCTFVTFSVLVNEEPTFGTYCKGHGVYTFLSFFQLTQCLLPYMPYGKFATALGQRK